MDPLTQASLGAAAAAAVSGGRRVRLALVVGAVAGAAPDIDVLIRSETDPLLALEYHRHFTHALLLAPLIGFIVAGLFRLLLFRSEVSYGTLALFAVAGTLTHGPLDACTSYGTLLYWPFSLHRESWDIISIIDPLLTGPLVALLIFAALRGRAGYARVALIWCLVYFSFGILQRERAQNYADDLAASRGHEPVQLTARPSLGNLLLWRIIYRDGATYHVDALRLDPWGGVKFYPGASVAAFGEEAARGLAGSESRLKRDIGRFRFFSQGYLYRHPDQPDVFGDLRYAVFPDSVIPLWGIRIDPTEPDRHVKMEYFRTVESRAFERLWRMIRGLPVNADVPPTDRNRAPAED